MSQTTSGPTKSSAPDPARVEERARELCAAAGQAPERWTNFQRVAMDELRSEERQYDKTVADSFPASDPPAHSGVTSDGDPVRPT